VNRTYNILYFIVLFLAVVLLYFSYTSINDLESTVSDLQMINENNENSIEQLSQKNYLLSEELTLLKQNNTDLSQAVNEFTLLLDNSMITEANLTTTKTFSHNKIIVDGKTLSLVNGTITNFGLQDAKGVAVEITWWVLSGCGCDAIPGRTELIKLDDIRSSSVYEFEKTFPFEFPTFQFISVEIIWN
tara:strand:+ start:422 stop:985 length:564 start_codon:yes stop_codon:yes gene_type:complete